MKCPKCELDMPAAFCSRAAGLSYTDPTSFEKFAFKDVDLSGAGLRKFIPWKGEWHLAHICENCAIYTIEYKQAYSRKEVEAMIVEMKVKSETVSF